MIRFVTDSTCYIPADLVKKYNIAIVPLKVQFGQETYGELTEISNRDFYRRMATTKLFPTTSQPSVEEFKDTYQNIFGQDPEAEILVLTVSSKLSGTHNAALTAAKQLSQAKITVFDSLSVAMGLGLMVLTGAEMATQGQSLEVIMVRLAQMRRDIRIFLLVDTLEYLKQGGRVGAASAFLGTLLQTKPILAIEAGKMELITRVRTKEKAIHRLVTELEQRSVDPGWPVQAGVMHARAEEEMARIARLMRDRFNISQLFALELGPVIGVHVGPGALGAGICPEPRES